MVRVPSRHSIREISFQSVKRCSVGANAFCALFLLSASSELDHPENREGQRQPVIMMYGDPRWGFFVGRRPDKGDRTRTKAWTACPDRVSILPQYFSPSCFDAGYWLRTDIERKGHTTGVRIPSKAPGR